MKFRKKKLIGGISFLQFWIAVFTVVATLQAITVFADDFPARSSTLVTDYTQTLSASEQQSLEQKLVAFNDSTSSQIAIVIMSSTGNYDISDYAVQLYNRWGIGQKQTNNGILILVAKDDRKVFITTGYGMEGVFPDALAKRVVNTDIVPYFKEGRYYEGLEAAINSITQIVKGEYSSDGSREEKVPWFVVIIFFFIIMIVIFSRIGSARNYARRNNLGFWAAWALMNAASNRHRGHWGGFSSGSGFGGGGGFGGFGGGSSGGGGAGGSW